MRTKTNNPPSHNNTNDLHDTATAPDESLVSGGDAESRTKMSILATVLGTLFGVVRVPFIRALGPDAAPVRLMRQLAATRANDVTVGHHEAVMPKRVTIAREDSDSAEHERAAELCGRRADMLELNEVSAAEEEHDKEGRKFDALKAKYDELPNHAKGLIAERPAFALALIIAFVDAGFVNAVLDHQGLPGVILWATTILVPGAIFGVNVGFGVGGFWIGEHLAPRARLRFAIGLLTAGVLAMIATFTLLAYSRNSAIHQFNDDLANWANGDDSVFRLAVSQWWFLGLQIAGSVAAAVFGACHAAGKTGRELRAELSELGSVVAGFAAKLGALREAVRELREQADEHTLLSIRVRGDARAAEVEIVELEKALPAKVDAEIAHGEAMVEKYGSVFQYTDQLYANGGVVRMAVPSVRRFGRYITPPPSDAEGSPAAEPPIWDPDNDAHNPLLAEEPGSASDNEDDSAPGVDGSADSPEA